MLRRGRTPVAPAPPPKAPATTPARRLRPSCISAPSLVCRQYTGRPRGCQIRVLDWPIPPPPGGSHGRRAPPALLWPVPADRLAVVRHRRVAAPVHASRRRGAAAAHRRDTGLAHHPLVAALRISADARGLALRRGAPPRHAGR